MEAEAQEQSIDALIDAVQRLSLADSIEGVQRVVRSAARELTGADGATIAMREGERCFYADEEAIGPLWKGQRFPLNACISGWSMLNREPAVIEDVYLDPRISHEAYRPTFVKSLVMVPIRSLDPIGAIGTYWAEKHQPTQREVALLQSLADATAVAIDNVGLSEHSHLDALTGALTRQGFFEEAGRRFGEARAEGRRCTVGFADVDGLKRANDILGYSAGSALIRDASYVLRAVAGHDAAVGRLGGDEFVAYIDGVADPEELRVRLTALCDQRNAGSGAAPELSISFGAVTVSADAEETLDAVIIEAVRQLYRDKRNRAVEDPTDKGPVRRTPRD